VRVSREEQCKQIAAACDGFAGINDLLDAQLDTLHTRAQVVLAIAGVLLTVSVTITAGKMIARPEYAHMHVAIRLLIAAGSADVLSAAVAAAGVLRVRWMSPPANDLQRWLMSRLEYRDRKTRALHVSIALLVVSVLLYQSAALIVLAGL
jgi:hypothetical protein